MKAETALLPRDRHDYYVRLIFCFSVHSYSYPVATGQHTRFFSPPTVSSAPQLHEKSRSNVPNE